MFNIYVSGRFGCGNRFYPYALLILSVIVMVMFTGLQPGHAQTGDSRRLDTPVLTNAAADSTLTANNICTTGETPMLPGQTRNDAANDVTPSHTDMVQASSSLTEQTLTAMFTFRDVPTTLPVQRKGFYNLEYAWTVYVDVDNSANTGAGNIVGEPYATGAEYILTAFRNDNVFPPETIPIESVIQQSSLFEYKPDPGTWQIVGNPLDVTHTFDADANTLTLVGNIPGITTSSRLTFAAFDNNVGAGFDDHIWDLTGCRRAITIPEAEQTALIALYQQTAGENWTKSDGWNVTNAPCTWYGVTCADGQVIRLELNENNLVGTIPAELANLTALQSLVLINNQLTGGIPAFLGDMTSLQMIRLPQNPLGGTLPANLGNLPNLQRLDLGKAQLTGSIPATFGNLSNLQRLEMSGNELNGTLPPELGNLSNLTVLNLGENRQLGGAIPDTYANLTQLRKIEIDGSQLSGPIPAWLGSITTMENIQLDNNQHTGTIPPELSNLPLIQVLELDDNQLTGSIPSELGDLTTLTELMLHDNQLTGSIPASLGNLTLLEELELQNNQLTGCIPPELGNLPNLRELNLSDNQLSCGIPPELSAVPAQSAGLAATGVLTSLEQLDLSINQLTGPIPTEFATLTTLTDLDLSYNFLTASDPALVAFLNAKDPDWAENQAGGRPVTEQKVYLPLVIR